MRANASAVESESLAVLDGASATDETHETLEIDEHAGRKHLLRAQFRRARILGGALAVAGVTTTALLLLQGDGLRIESFDAGDKSDLERKQLLDYYNSVSGSVGSLVAKPIELFLALLVAAAFLCFATDFTLAGGRASGHWKYAPLAALSALAYLFSSGINSLNVQLTTGALSVCIAASDLALTESVAFSQPLFANGSLRTSWNRSFAENASANEVANTILRTSAFPSEDVKSRCSFPHVNEQQALPSVSFGFPSRAWQADVLATALAPAAALKLSMRALNGSGDLDANASLPMPTVIANDLVIYGVHVLTSLKLDNGSYELQAGSFSGSPKPRRVVDFYNLSEGVSEMPSPASTRSFLDASNAVWRKTLGNLNRVVLDDVTVEYTRTRLSETVTFDAVTFELPFAITAESATTSTAGGDSHVEIDALQYCSPEGCVLYAAPVSEYQTAASTQTRVQAASICVDAAGSEDMTLFLDETQDAYAAPCSRTSTTSMLIAGVGKRVEGGVWDRLERASGVSVRLTNLRLVYSVTVGRLSWVLEDLAQVFGASCRAASCEGLRHQLRPDASEFLLVGSASLPLARLSRVNVGEYPKTKWRALVALADNAPAARRFDIALPRRFSRLTASGAALRTSNVSACIPTTDDFVLMVEKNHLYMERSLQTSYTAALYFLFQSAVRHSRANATAAAAGAAPPLAFAGNAQMLDVQLSLPTANAVVSLVGCALLVALSVAVAALAGRAERELQQRASAETVAEAVVSNAKFPPALLTLALEQQATAASEEEEETTATQCVALEDLRIESAVFRRAGDAQAQSAFHVGPALS